MYEELGVQFICAQVEQSAAQAATEHCHHWQGYIELKGRATAPQIATVLGWLDTQHFRGLWMDGARAKQSESIAYTKKLETRSGIQYEWGVPKPPGAIEERERLVQDLQAGMSMDEISCRYPRMVLQYGANVERLKRQFDKPMPWRDVTTFCFYGASGTGKTSAVYSRHAHEDVYAKLKGEFWDGYEGQPVILLDEFDGTQLAYTELLKVLDGHPLRVNIKGSSRAANWTNVYICSNVHPDSFYPNISGERLMALERRLPHNYRIHFGSTPFVPACPILPPPSAYPCALREPSDAASHEGDIPPLVRLPAFREPHAPVAVPSKLDNLVREWQAHTTAEEDLMAIQESMCEEDPALTLSL